MVGFECMYKAFAGLSVATALLSPQTAAAESAFYRPWAAKHRAIVLDAYERNIIDLTEISKDKRIVGLIHKGSDGLPPVYGCKSAANTTELELCKKDWKVYAVSKELYRTRRALAKALGMKWGAYHLGRPGNPIDQANHFIDFADPQPDELMAIDIEDVGSGTYISLKDAQEFSNHIFRRLGRYPVLYVNGSTAKLIAEQRDEYPLLSRLHLWYARYKPTIDQHFGIGNWDKYSLWQFSSQVNCGANSCPYRVSGAENDIDVNVADMSVGELQKAWPLDGLVPTKDLRSSPQLSEMLVAFAKSSLPNISGFSTSAQNIALAYAPARPATHFIDHYEVDPIITASIGFVAYERSVRD